MATKSEFFPRRGRGSGTGRDGEPPRETAAGSPPDAALGAEVDRLTNRTALLTLAAAFALIATLATVPRALSSGTTALRVAAALALVGEVVAVLAVWRTRARLRAARARAGAHPT